MDASQLRSELPNDVPFTQFLDTIVASDSDVMSFDAFVNISSLGDVRHRELADKIVEEVSNRMKYRFVYHSVYEFHRTEHTRFKYHCAQDSERQKKPRKGVSKGQERDKQQMSTFPCHGWMYITIPEGASTVLIKLKHEYDHIPYFWTSLPGDVVDFVRKNSSMTPTQLWDRILEQHPEPKFTRQSVYHQWRKESRKVWQRDEDQIKSARILIEERTNMTDTSAISAEEIPLPEKEGFEAIAFSLPFLVRMYGNTLREISLDSAWNTNGSQFEVFALLGEVQGSGCPLGYLLLQSPKRGDPGGKEAYITALLTHFRTKWNIAPTFTLTDKDWSEINAFRSVFPEAKHQLCFWHALRAVKTRLSILRRRPKFYNVQEAISEFSWIDPEFVPVAQLKDKSHASQPVANLIPRVTLRVGGVRMDTAPSDNDSTGTDENLSRNDIPRMDAAPPQDSPPARTLVIKLNGVVRSVAALPKMTQDPENEALLIDIEDDNAEDENVLDQVQALNVQQDSEDGPEWMFDDEEKLSKDPEYVFCPAAHRQQILSMFTKHFCQHPIFPERRNDGLWDEKRIRKEAVHEMYMYCKQRSLSEVWGYLWASWYSPKMWSLWARSTSPYLSRLRTTMAVENFWRQLKHNYLQHVSRPRLDHLVYILIHKVTPAYYAKMRSLQDTHRMGRPKALTTYQRYFKKSWKILATRKIDESAQYTTNVRQWLCNCGQQKFNCHHICKHLVQAVASPSIAFWGQVKRRRVVPIYQHPFLVPKDDPHDEYPDPSGGCITDGDDYSWSGDPAALESRAGWTTLEQGKSTLLSQKRSASPSGSNTKRTRFSGTFDAQSGTPERASSPPAVDYGASDELENDEIIDKTRTRARRLREAADRLDKQADLTHIIITR